MLKLTKYPNHNYRPTDDEFKQAQEIANSCANEHFFPCRETENDCDYCPSKKDCDEFWDDVIANSPVYAVSLTGSYLETIRQKFEEFRERKRQG